MSFSVAVLPNQMPAIMKKLRVQKVPHEVADFKSYGDSLADIRDQVFGEPDEAKPEDPLEPLFQGLLLFEVVWIALFFISLAVNPPDLDGPIPTSNLKEKTEIKPDTGVTFANVAGCDESMAEIA